MSDDQRRDYAQRVLWLYGVTAIERLISLASIADLKAWKRLITRDKRRNLPLTED